ncbi:hypothetical protein OAF44_04475, partial [Akkermansiaceae bacterium]|nr:hypothetical protein [Akkermansiaceae bacterium]
LHWPDLGELVERDEGFSFSHGRQFYRSEARDGSIRKNFSFCELFPLSSWGERFIFPPPRKGHCESNSGVAQR